MLIKLTPSEGDTLYISVANICSLQGTNSKGHTCIRMIDGKSYNVRASVNDVAEACMRLYECDEYFETLEDAS